MYYHSFKGPKSLTDLKSQSFAGLGSFIDIQKYISKMLT